MNIHNKEKTTKENECKKEKNNEFLNILDNIIGDYSDDEATNKRRNSFSGRNIFKKKEKVKKIINLQKEKDNINQIENQSSISSLIKNEINELKNTDILNKKSKENSEPENILSNSLSKENYLLYQNKLNKNNSLEKSSNLSSSSHGKNFILKSELRKLNQKEKSNKQMNYNKNDFDYLLTEKIKNQEELNKNQFYKFFFDYNKPEKINYKENINDKNNITSNTYIDIEEVAYNKEKEEFKNNLNDNNNIINNLYGKPDLVDEKKHLKNIIKNNINFINKNNINKKEEINNNNNLKNDTFNNNILNNKNEKEDSKIIENKLKEKVFKVIANNQIKENEKELMFNQENQVNYINKEKNKNQDNFQKPLNHSKPFNNFNEIQNQPKKENIYSYPGYFYYSMQPSIFYNTNITQNLYQYNYKPIYLNQNINNNKQFINIYNNYYNNNMGISQLNRNKINNNNVKISYNNDKELVKDSLQLIKTQIGFRILQDKINSDSKFANELLFPEFKNNLKEICCDLFGNYLIQSLLEKLTLENIDIFLTLIQDNLYEICLTENGSRTIQKLIARIYDSPLLINKLIFNLSNKDIGILIKSPYGNHMIQKYLTLIKKIEYTNFIYNYLFYNFMDVVKSKHGVCVIQKALSEGNDQQRKKIINMIINNLEIIMKDCYANFLIQYIITKIDESKYNEIFPIIEKIEENIVCYCKYKFSASVIEKCFEKGHPKIIEHIIKYLLDYHSEYIIEIILNSFGIYVIKKALNIKNIILKERIKNIIIANIEKIKEANNGSKIIENFAHDFKEFSCFLK